MKAEKAPTAFISYSWDNDTHKQWVHDFATRLRSDGIEVTLDQWHAVPGDQLPRFMEAAVRDNDYVIIICTPKYRDRSDSRTGGVGYEGDIIAAEIFTTRNHRKFIPVLRAEDWEASAPVWLKGKYYVPLNSTPYSEEHYADLTATIHHTRPIAPPIGVPPHRRSRVQTSGTVTTYHCGVISGNEISYNSIGNSLIWSEKFITPLKALEVLPRSYVPFISELRRNNLILSDAELIESGELNQSSPFEGIPNSGSSASITYATSNSDSHVIYDVSGDSVYVYPAEHMDSLKWNTLLHAGVPVEMLMKEISTATFARYLREGGLVAAPVFKPTTHHWIPFKTSR